MQKKKLLPSNDLCRANITPCLVTNFTRLELWKNTYRKTSINGDTIRQKWSSHHSADEANRCAMYASNLFVIPCKKYYFWLWVKCYGIISRSSRLPITSEASLLAASTRSLGSYARRILTFDTIIALVNALIISRTDYYSSILVGYDISLLKLQGVLNSAARLIARRDGSLIASRQQYATFSTDCQSSSVLVFNYLRNLQLHPVELTRWTCVSSYEQPSSSSSSFCCICVATSSFHRRGQSVTIHAARSVNVKRTTSTTPQRWPFRRLISSPAEVWTIHYSI